MKVKTEISIKIEKDWRLLNKELAAKAANRLNVAALNTQAEAVLALSKKGTGKIYKKAGRTHQASAAGFPPSTDTGRLRDSIKVIQYATSEKLESVAGTNVKYATFLEFGTVDIAPRPFWNPSIDKAREKLLKQLRNLKL